MRIMIVNSYYYPEIHGGAEFSVKKLAEGLHNAGNEVCVLCSGTEEKKEIINGVSVVRFVSKNIARACNTSQVGFLGKKIRRFQEIYNRKNYKAIDKAIKDFCPDVIHTNNLYNITPVIWKVAKDNNIRLVHTLRDYYLICPRVSLRCKRTKEKNCDNPSVFCKYHKKKNIGYSNNVDIVTAPSKITLDMIINEGLFKKSRKKVVVNAIDFEEYDTDRMLKEKESHFNTTRTIRFVYLGTLTEQKGICWLIDSFNSITNKDRAELIIAGKGDLEDYVKENCARNGHIRFVGFLSEIQVDELLNQTDVLVCPSLWDEPFGRVVLDAYKHAMPVISSNKGALPELVKDGYSGTVVDANDSYALIDCLNKYCDNYSLVMQQGNNSIACLNEYSIENQVNSFLHLYRKEDADVIN